jgi:hypothetical protein
MSERRPLGVPGAHRPAMENTCGYDAGITGGPHCGKPATYHLTAGSPEAGPSDWAMMACDEHAQPAKPYSWDWHAVSGVCGIPGTLWQPVQYQGNGFCFWPEAEAMMHEAVSINEDTPATRHVPHLLDLRI